MIMWDCIYGFLKDFQTIIVGVLGFCGVIYTLRNSAQLSREQHDRNIDHDRKTLRVALRAELELNRNTFIENSSTDGATSDALYPSTSLTDIYLDFKGKLGALSQEEVSSVIKTYAMLYEVPSKLRILTSEEDSSLDKPGYIFIRGANHAKASAIYEVTLQSINNTLSILEQN